MLKNTEIRIASFNSLLRFEQARKLVLGENLREANLSILYVRFKKEEDPGGCMPYSAGLALIRDLATLIGTFSTVIMLTPTLLNSFSQVYFKAGRQSILRESMSFLHNSCVLPALRVASSASLLLMTSSGDRKASSPPYKLISLFLTRILLDSRRNSSSALNHSGNLPSMSTRTSETSCILGYSIPTAFKTAFKDGSTHS